jgi:SAM-dependent methyltransferase
MDTFRNLQADAFAGTAAAYLRYRPPYPRALLADLVVVARLSKAPVLLDLACGPGRVALDLARHFERVWAIDLEPEMIATGREEAARRGIRNVCWLKGRAEAAAVAANSVDLITIGEAFHRLDQAVIVERAQAWLKPGGCIATLGTDGLLAGGEPWKELVGAVARRWMQLAYPGGWAKGRAGAALGPEGVERLLNGAGFVDVQRRLFEQLRTWSFEEIVGYMKSTSVCAEGALGAAFPAFEADLKAALNAEGPPFQERLRCGYTLGRKRP